MSSNLNPDFENFLQEESNSEFNFELNSFDALYQDIIDDGPPETAPRSDQLTQVPSSGAIGNIQQEPDLVPPEVYIEDHHAFPPSTDFIANVESNTNIRTLDQGLGDPQLQSQADSWNPTTLAEPPQSDAWEIIRHAESCRALPLSSHMPLRVLPVTASWTGPQKCVQSGCLSKETFRTRRALERHLQNVHLNPLVCKVTGCRYSRPFSRPRDLQRHMDSTHGGSRPYECPITSCDAHNDGFTRKDHLQLHLRTKHPNLRCMLSHCHEIVLDTEQDSHLQQSHGPYECRVGGCTEQSRFSEGNLKRHLQTCHGLSYSQAREITLTMKSTNTGRLAAAYHHLTTATRSRLTACMWCSSQKGSAEDMTSTDLGD